jgi:hypothetical protein
MLTKENDLVKKRFNAKNSEFLQISKVFFAQKAF